MNKLNLGCATVLTSALLALQVSATEAPAAPASQRELPGVVIGAGVTAMATVEALNQETREITLREADGSLVTLIAGDAVRNFAQIAVGDRVVVQHDVGLVMALSATTSKIRERTDRLEMARAEPGQKPGGIIRKTVEATASVMAVDRQARTVTLRGPLRTVTLPVAEDINLDAVKVGDMVKALYQESIAISVQPAPAGQ